MKLITVFSGILRICVVLGLLAGVASCQSAGGGAQDVLIDEANSFVEVRGSQFYLGGRPYYYAGVNFWYGAYLGASEKGKARLVRELDQLKSLGVTNLRVLAGSEASNLVMAVNPAIMTSPGVYDASLLAGLDFFMDEMAKREMKAVLYFTNFWQWSGGMAQLVAWGEGGEPIDPDVSGDWNGFMQYSAKFYSSEKAKGWLNDFIAHLVNRKNTVNGKWYKEDTAIMTWELANEPRPGSDPDGHKQYEDFQQWVSDTARFIKSLDSNHLVTTGSEGLMGASRDMKMFVGSHQDKNVDYLTFHLWPKNWSWYDAKKPEKTFTEALAKTKAYILQHIQVAKQMNKPIVLEEFGLERDGGELSLSTSTHYRDEFLKEVFNLVEQQAKIGSPIAGTNVWAWGGEGRAQSQDFIWRSGDPFTGDPPQETQGLNSIFNTDVSTLDVLAAHAAALNALRK